MDRSRHEYAGTLSIRARYPAPALDPVAKWSGARKTGAGF